MYSFTLTFLISQSLTKIWQGNNNKKALNYTKKINAQDTAKLSKKESDTVRRTYEMFTFLGAYKTNT